MTVAKNKLQIRAEILNAIKFLESGDKHTVEFLNGVLSPLKEIEDKTTVLDVLIKEIISNQNDDRFYILSFLLENLIPKEKLEDELWKLLTLDTINDSVKSNIINILKDLGNQINYEKYSEYFENPDAVIDSDTEKLLKNALYNPEVLIDFLDFIEALPEKDRNLLIDSISEDYKGDELANLFAPVAFSNPNSDLCKYAMKRLGESKSELAIKPLNYVLEYSNNEEIKNVAKKSLIELKLSGVKETDKEKKYFEEVFSVSDMDEVYISLPDGRGNVGIIAGRNKLNSQSISMFAVVFNNIVGIVDCFGFNDISSKEYSKIISKFYLNQEKIIIPTYVAKMLLSYAEEISRKTTGKMSYEYVCWKKLLFDSVEASCDLISELESRLHQVDVSLKDLSRLYSTALFDKWFFFPSDNEKFSLLVNDIIELLKVETLSENIVENLTAKILDYKSEIFSETLKKQIDFRLLLTAYLLSINGLQEYADILNSIRFNDVVKNELYTNILRISVYEFLLREREKYLNTAISTNIFSKRNEANKCFVEKNILNLTIKSLESKWGV